MPKAVLLSVQPKWCELIASGKKTVEVRKTKPKLPTPFKCYIYCTKGFKPNTAYSYKTWAGCGKVIGEFVCDAVDRMAHCGTCNSDIRLKIVDNNLYCKELDYAYLNKCQLSYFDINEYSNGGDVYGWHISDLVIYDKPKELSEFKKINQPCWYGEMGISKRDCPECKNKGCFVTRPPQSWCYVEG